MQEINKANTVVTLKDIGLTGTWDGSAYIISGDNVGDFIPALEAMGGKKKIAKKITGSTEFVRTEYRFKNANEKTITETLIKASATSNIFQQIALWFAGAFASQYADVVRSRGSRSAMIARKDVKGDEVVRGYEEDALTRITKAAYSLAGGEAKSRTALNMIKAITGQDVSWAEYSEIKRYEGDFTEYEKQREESGAEYIDRETFNEIVDNWLKAPHNTDYLKFVSGRGIDPAKQVTAHSESMALFKDMMRNEERVDRVIGTLKGLAVLKYLGFRVAAPFVNVTNMVIGVPAAMMGYGKISLRDSFKHIRKAYGEYYNFKYKKGGVVSPEIKRVFMEIEKRGWDQSTFNQEGLAVMKGQMSYGYAKMIETSMAMFTWSEKLNRVASITAAYKGLLETKPELTFEERMRLSHEISNNAHGIYGKANRPSAMRGGNIGANVLQMAYVFKTFTHNFLSTMTDLAVNEKDAKAALWMLFSPVVFGATSSVGMAILIQAIGKAMGSDDPEEDFYRSVESRFGSTAGNFSRFGIFGAAGHGISLKGSLAIGVSDLPTSFKDLIGAPGSVVTDAIEGTGEVLKGNTSKGFEKILPLALGNPLKGYREMTEGVTTKSNAPVFFDGKPLKADVIDTFLRALSFNPSRIAGAREKIYGDSVQKTAMSERKSAIYAKVKKARMNGDDMEDITIEIAAYNQRAKHEGGSLITSKSLRSVLKRSKITEEL